MAQICSYRAKCNGKDCDQPFCIRRFKLDELYKKALMTEQQKKHVALRVDEDGTDLQEFKRLSEFLAKPVDFVQAGTNLFLHSSNCGNGKTTFAIRFIQAYLDAIWHRAELTCKALFISVPSFLQALKDAISGPNEYAAYIKQHILEADIVVWDDIAAKVGSDFELNHLLGFIDSRIALGKANIYTSNLSQREMANALGARLASRICNCSIDIELRGADKRKICRVGGVQ